MKKEVVFVQDGKELANKVAEIVEKSQEQSTLIYLDDELAQKLRTTKNWCPVIYAGKYDIYLNYHKEHGFESVMEIRMDGHHIYLKPSINDEMKAFFIVLTN